MGNKKKGKSKKKLKLKFKIVLIIIFIILYSMFIGTNFIITKEFKVSSNKIDKKTHGLKILHFSDLNYGSSLNVRKLKELIKKINDCKPDIVIFSGDLIYDNYKITENEEKEITQYLKDIKCELGKYYITGESDKKEYISLLNGSDFINLEDGEQLIYKSKNTPILLTSKNKAKTFMDNNKDFQYYKILVIHNPDDFDEMKNLNFDLVLAGHTLNGSINIPKLKNILIDSEYKKSYYKINNTRMYINPGIGTKRIKARLFNHPKIYLFRLNSSI